MAPIFSYLSEQIEAIPMELIISKIRRGALENSFYLELLNVKLKSIESSGALNLFEEDFKHLNQHDQIRFKEILVERSIELIKKDNGK